jgi:hypothetical protein
VRRRPLAALIAVGVLAVLALAITVPQRIVSPGALMRGHAQIEGDCFACHAPWRGAASQRCARCHRPADIGLRTTQGVPLPQRTLKMSFHQELIEQDCIACHSDHAGPRLTERSRKPFSHSLLRPPARQLCGSCHAAPPDEAHRDLTVGCARCHRPDRWKPADFDHAALAPIEQKHCQGCHRPPADNLHRPIAGDCQLCHNPKRWKPATFDHDKVFALDANHNAPCATCHTGGDIHRATCYGCHAHRPDQIRVRHLEEGIRDFERCARCHRSASGEAEGGESTPGAERD